MLIVLFDYPLIIWKLIRNDVIIFIVKILLYINAIQIIISNYFMYIYVLKKRGKMVKINFFAIYFHRIYPLLYPHHL